MSLWLTLAVNSIALGGLLFLLSSGFSLIFGLMRIPNLMHGSVFMLGAHFGVSLPARPRPPAHLRGTGQVAGLYFPLFRLVIVLVAAVIAIALWLMVDWTRL